MTPLQLKIKRLLAKGADENLLEDLQEKRALEQKYYHQKLLDAQKQSKLPGRRKQG